MFPIPAEAADSSTMPPAPVVLPQPVNAERGSVRERDPACSETQSLCMAVWPHVPFPGRFPAIGYNSVTTCAWRVGGGGWIPQYLAAIHHLSQRVRRAGQILKNIMWMLSLPRPRLRLRSSASADLCALGRPCHPVLILGLPLPACVASSNCLDLLLSLFCNVPLCTRDQPQNK